MKHYEINGNTYQLDDAVYDHLMDALCNVNAFKNKAARLSRDNQQLMAQISAKAEQELVKCEYCRGRGSYISSSATNPGYVRCPACNGTGTVKPKPRFRVGDWVTDGVINGSITSLTDDLAWVKTGFYEYHMSLRNLTLISPSDVVVDFGSFRGTIELNSHPFRKQITVKNTQGDAIAYINIVYLDTPTRELVRELLGKQGENNG